MQSVGYTISNLFYYIYVKRQNNIFVCLCGVVCETAGRCPFSLCCVFVLFEKIGMRKGFFSIYTTGVLVAPTLSFLALQNSGRKVLKQLISLYKTLYITITRLPIVGNNVSMVEWNS